MGLMVRVGGPERDRRVVYIGSALAIGIALFVAFRMYPLPYGAAIRAVSLGMLTALLAMGLALIYRANRVLNFAQADLGSVPTSFAVALVVFSNFPYPLGFVIGLVVSVVLGGVVELVFVRRFKHASRLVLTVATLGITQLLVLLGILIPRWWGRNAASERLPQAFGFYVEVGTVRLLANDFVALVAAPVVMVLVALFLNKTRVGIAVRAAAERGDRANMLGIPVNRLSTIVWAIAAALSFVALYLRAGILGFPIGSAFDLTNLLFAMAALVIGRMQNLVVISIAGVAIGFLGYWVTWTVDTPLLAVPMVSIAVLVALLSQRRSGSRRDNDSTSSWQGADEVRPLDDATARLVWVRLARYSCWVVVVAAVVLLPIILRVDRLIQLNETVIFCIIGISMLVLTGWAGQISLGQMGFVAVGGAVSALCTDRWNIDLTLSLLIAAAAGAFAALLVGLPALRLQGLYLAVTTLAFGVSVTAWLLNDRFFGWIPRTRLKTSPLFGKIDIDTPTRFYAYTIVVLVIVIAVIRGIRRSRTGRVIVAMRENERGAQSFSVSTIRAKLTAFMLSGAVAGIAGGLYVHMNHAFSLGQFSAGTSFGVLTSAIIGGLGSVTGVVVGAVYIGATIRLPNEWRLLATSFSVLLILLVMPAGLGSQLTKLRDVIARAAIKRQGPTLADVPISVAVLDEMTELIEPDEPTLVSVEGGAE